MAIVRLLLLSLVAIGVPILGFGMEIEFASQGALCGGRPYARVSVPNGASPYVELTADGVSGPFLLDYGATRSSPSAAAAAGDGCSGQSRRFSGFPALESSELSPC